MPVEVDNIYNISRSWGLSAYPPYLIETWPVTGSVSSQTPGGREPLVPPLFIFQEENWESFFLSVYKSCERLHAGGLPTVFVIFVFSNMDFSSYKTILLFIFIFKITVYHFSGKKKFTFYFYQSHYVV